MNLAELLARTQCLHDRIAADAGLTRCRVYCTVCGRSEDVDGADCLRSGWPKCHGYTMTLDKDRAGTAALPGERDG